MVIPRTTTRRRIAIGICIALLSMGTTGTAFTSKNLGSESSRRMPKFHLESSSELAKRYIRKNLFPPYTEQVDEEEKKNQQQQQQLLLQAKETVNDDSVSDVAFCVIDFENIAEPYLSPLDSESTFVEFTDDGLAVPAGRVGRSKERLANLLKEPFVEVIIASSVLLNSFLVSFGTLESMSIYKEYFRLGEFALDVVFTLDFLGRWFSSSQDAGRHVFNAQFALDVFVVIIPLVVGITPDSFWTDTLIPSCLTSPSGLFNLELLRVLRLRRVLRDLPTFERFAERALLGAAKKRAVKKLLQEWQLQLARVLLSLFTLVSVATGLIYTTENEVNPSINNYFDALYFGLTTLTTVGFGDISPQTWQGKLVVCGSILVGVAVLPAEAAALVEALLEREEAKRTQRVSSGVTRPPNGSSTSKKTSMLLETERECPQCGATFHWSNAQFCYSCGKVLD